MSRSISKQEPHREKSEARLVELGEQATASYRRAIGGMREVLMFYATVKLMQMEVERLAEGGLLPIGNKPSKEGGRPAKPTDLRWLFERYAPGIPERSAYRLMEVGEGIEADYRKLVGGKIAKQFALPMFVTTPAEDLPATARAKQEQLFSYVEGTSKQSWLDKLRPHKLKGGARQPSGDKVKVPEEDSEELEALDIWTPLQRSLTLELHDVTWAHLPNTGPVSRKSVLGVLTDLSSAIRQANKSARK
jgi:hypothetical protein